MPAHCTHRVVQPLPLLDSRNRRILWYTPLVRRCNRAYMRATKYKTPTARSWKSISHKLLAKVVHSHDAHRRLCNQHHKRSRNFPSAFQLFYDMLAAGSHQLYSRHTVQNSMWFILLIPFADRDLLSRNSWCNRILFNNSQTLLNVLGGG